MDLFPTSGPWGMEAAMQLKEDAPARQSELRRLSHSRAGIGQGGIEAPLINVQTGTSLPPLVPHNPVLLLSG